MAALEEALDHMSSDESGSVGAEDKAGVEGGSDECKVKSAKCKVTEGGHAEGAKDAEGSLGAGVCRHLWASVGKCRRLMLA